MSRLEGRVAIVTGAAKGMGREICLALAREGADLALAAREAPPLDALAREIQALGRRAVVQPTDVTVEAQVKALAEATRAAFGGRVDVLVNAAGITGPIETPVSEIAVEDFDEVLAVNVRGTFLPIKHVLPTMLAQRYGKIVSVSAPRACAATSTAPPIPPRSGRSAVSRARLRSKPAPTTSTSTPCTRASWPATGWTSSAARRRAAGAPAGRPSVCTRNTSTRWRSVA